MKSVLIISLSLGYSLNSDEYIGNNVKDYYKEFICRPYENSNVINVFDLFNKLYFQYTLDALYVFPNSYSFYDIKKRKL